MSNPSGNFSTSNQQRASEPGPEDRDRLRFFTTPLSQRGWPRWVVYLVSMLGGIYLLNPTAGLFELLPDNLPLVGNLDEAGAFMLIWYGIVEYLKRRKSAP